MSDRNRPDDDRFGRETTSDEDRFDWSDEGGTDARDPTGRVDGPGDRGRDVAGPSRRGNGSATAGFTVAGLTFTRRELLDLAVAWVALGLAFAFFFFGRGVLTEGAFVLGLSLAVSMGTVGVGFLLHELAHKIVAVRFGQIAHFKADYGMLVLAVVAGLGGFLFAAPGAVHHRGRITERENGLIAIAGPVTNVLLVVPFLPLTVLPGPVGLVGSIGVAINAVLAAFNMLPFGPLDGRTVLAWSKAVYVPFFLLTLALAGVSVGLFLGLI